MHVLSFEGNPLSVTAMQERNVKSKSGLICKLLFINFDYYGTQILSLLAVSDLFGQFHAVARG